MRAGSVVARPPGTGVAHTFRPGDRGLTLLAWGTPDQKKRYLVPQAQGKKIATYGLTEPAAGSDARGIQSVAIKKGDRYVLTGEKMWISLADVADNFIVFAWSDRPNRGAGLLGGRGARMTPGMAALPANPPGS